MKKKLKILLVQPNFHKYYVPFLPNFEPLVMIMLAGHVKDIAESKIFDRRYESEKAFIKTIKEFKPDIVATRTHTSGEIFTAKRILELAKKIRPKATTIIGGQHPTLLPDDLAVPFIDLICVGAGEKTFREVTLAKLSQLPFDQIKGLAIQRKGELIFTKKRTLTNKPFSWPSLERNLAGKYKSKFSHGFTVTSLGCPHRCNFCALWVAGGGTYITRDVDNTVDDIASIPQTQVYIGDDNTFHDYNHALQICNELKRRGIKKRYGAYARTDTIVEHAELFRKWREIGLETLVVGFEVVSQAALKNINKHNTLENNLKAIEILNKLKIQNYAHFIIFPDFEVKNFKEIWDFIKKYKIAQPYFVPFTPYPGTPLFSEFKEKKQFSTYNFGFYNLEYMVCKTTLPKWRFYFEYLKLWLKSLSPLTYFSFRKKFFPFSAYLYRIKILTKAFIPYLTHICSQIKEEKNTNYEDIENELFPSQKEGYKFRYSELIKKK